MNLQDHLLRRAQAFWDRGQQLPLDLFYQLLGAGLDVEALEAQHMKEPA
jgi:hypothetical protein